jgi:hypothetical protein
MSTELLEKPSHIDEIEENNKRHLFISGVAAGAEKTALCGAVETPPQVVQGTLTPPPTCSTCIFKAKHGWGRYYDPGIDSEIQL